MRPNDQGSIVNSLASMAAKGEDRRSNPLVHEFAKSVSDDEKAKTWFQENQLFPKEMKCDPCDTFMDRKPSAVSKDGEIWKCRKCKKGCGLRKGTMFEVSNTKLLILHSIYHVYLSFNVLDMIF